jgi:hypothetical protein
MILVDTSAWVRALRGVPAYRDGLAELRNEKALGGHELVHGELLAGDRGGRAAFLSDYQRLPWAPRLPHFEVAEFVRLRRLQGRGAGWLDLHLLAAALVGRWRLWTADQRLAELAGELGIGYRP